MQRLAGDVNLLLDQGFAGFPYAVAAGTANVTLAAATQGTASVTFPAGRFTQNPMLLATIVLGTAQVAYVRSTGTITKDGAGLAVNTTPALSTTYTVHWLAIQMVTGAGPG
jgi:hypothetical protein